MAHELGITKPAIGHNHRRGQEPTASAESRHASIQHALEPVQFVAAWRPRAAGGWLTDGKVDGDDQCAIANDHNQEHTITSMSTPKRRSRLSQERSGSAPGTREERLFSHPPYTTQFGVGTAPEQRRTHHPDDFPQGFVLAAQAPCDLGHEVLRQFQIIEILLEGRGGV
jgi:hypothetical protein